MLINFVSEGFLGMNIFHFFKMSFYRNAIANYMLRVHGCQLSRLECESYARTPSFFFLLVTIKLLTDTQFGGCNAGAKKNTKILFFLHYFDFSCHAKQFSKVDNPELVDGFKLNYF